MRYLIVLLLAGCATTYPAATEADRKWTAFEGHMTVVEAKVKAGTMTQRDAAISALEKMRALDIQDPYLEEAWTYRAMLAGKVERGEITEDEARYLDTTKVNEIVERAVAAERGRQATRPPVYFPRAVRCKPDGWGGVVCR